MKYIHFAQFTDLVWVSEPLNIIVITAVKEEVYIEL